MNRKVIKVVSILLMVLMAVTMLSTSVFAITTTVSGNGGAGSMDSITFSSNDSKTKDVATNLMGTLISVIQVVGMAIAVIMLVVMAIKYVSAAPSEKAEIKKSAAIYVVGAVVLFAASGILQVVKNFADANINNLDKPTGYVEMIDDTYFG